MKATTGQRARKWRTAAGGGRWLAVLALLTASVSPQALAATPWPTTSFRVDFAPATSRDSPGRDAPPTLDDRGRATMPPAADGQPADDPEGHRQLAYDALAMFFERSLADAAAALQAAGYEPPNLPLYRDGRGETFYRVQVVDESREAALKDLLGVYHSATSCGDTGISEGTWFGIEAGAFVPLTPSREAFLYQVLAHELLHAIQASYPASSEALNGCEANTEDYMAVSEGTAEALSQLLARRQWPKYYLQFGRQVSYAAGSGGAIEMLRFNGPTGYLDQAIVGLRRYDRPFLDVSSATRSERRLAAYTTTSFWFNLMDRYGIGLVDHLLRRPLAHGDYPSLVEWLDAGLRAWTPSLDGLFILFPHFVAEFASQAGSRFPFAELPNFGPGQSLDLQASSGAAPGGADGARLKWVQRVLGECQRIELSPESPGPIEVRFALQRLAAGCLDIRWSGFNERFELYVEAEHGSLRLIDQVSIGLVYQRADGAEQYCYDAVKPHYDHPLWTCTHDKPFLGSGAQPLTYTKRWSEPDVRFSGEGRRFLAVANVAREAHRTRAFDDSEPLIVRVGSARAEGRDGRSYDPPYSAFKGMPTMGGAFGFDKETQYGITEAPLPAAMLLNFDLPLADGDTRYSVSWMGQPPALGYEGPFRGTVTAQPAGAAQAMIGSFLCQRHKDGVVGKVLRFDRDHLWIDIDAELCELPMPPPADGNFPVVDRVRAGLRLPFGWRHDPASAPADIVTPGMQVFIERHAQRVPMVLSGTWGSPGQGGSGDTGDTGDIADTGDTGDVGTAAGGASAGGGTYSVLQGGPCTCSCEELAAFDAQGEAAKASGDAAARMAVAREIMQCFAPCQQQYLLCRLGTGGE